MGEGGRGIHLSLHYHHQNVSCIKVRSNVSYSNVSLIATDKVTKQCPQTTTFLNRMESRSGIEPRSNLRLTNLTPYRQAKPAL